MKPRSRRQRGMFDPAEIQELLLDEIELLTAMCRGRKFQRPMEIQQDTLAITLDIAAGQVPDEGESM